MTVAPFASSDVDRLQPARRAPAVVRVGLLGLGQIGAAVARLAAARSPARHVDVEVTAALVRDPLRARAAHGVKATADAEAVFATRPTSSSRPSAASNPRGRSFSRRSPAAFRS